MSLNLESELAGQRINYEQFRAIEAESGSEIETCGNKTQIELLEGFHSEVPEGGFEDDKEGMEFIIEALEEHDPSWETLVWAASMHCGGVCSREAFDEAIEEWEARIEATRTLTVSICGATDLSNMKYKFFQAVDSAFALNVQDIHWLASELPGEAAGVFELEVKGDAEAMKTEAEWMLPTEFDNVQVTLQPTEEERKKMVEAHEEYIESLPESELQADNHKVDS